MNMHRKRLRPHAVRPSSESYSIEANRPGGPRCARPIRFLAGVACLLYATTIAQAGQPTFLPQQLDLPTAVSLAREHSPVLQQARVRVQFQEAVFDEANAAGRVRLDTTGGYTQFDTGAQQSFGAENAPEDNRWQGVTEAAITVYSGGQKRTAIRRDTELRDASVADLESVSRDVVSAVHEAYYDAQLAQATIAVQEEAIRVLEQQLDDAKNRLAAGTGAKFDAIQAEVAVANARPPLVRSQNNLRRRVDTLRRQVGLPFAGGMDAEDIQLDPVGEAAALDLELESSLKRAAQSRPELDDIALQLAAARSQVEFRRRKSLPLLDLFANYGAESDQFGDEDILHGWTAGARLNWSMADGGGRKAMVAQATADLRRLEERRRELALTIGGEVRQAFYDYEEARGIMAVTRLVIDQAEEALRLARNRYDAGKGTQIDVLNSQLALTRARLEDTTALTNLHRSLIRIKHATGLPLR